MFVEHAENFLTGMILKTHQQKCSWMRYPMAFPMKNAPISMFIQEMEHQFLQNLDSKSSFFFPCAGGFVLFLTIGEHMHLCIQQDVSKPVVDVCDYPAFEHNLKVLKREISNYVEMTEAQPDGLYSFLAEAIDGADFTSREDVPKELGATDER